MKNVLPFKPKRDKTPPHVRIPDAAYKTILPYLTPIETKLWLAMKCCEQRLRGGVLKKTIARIIEDQGLARTSGYRAFRQLCSLGLCKKTREGAIQLLNPPSVSTAVSTPFPSVPKPDVSPGDTPRVPHMTRSRVTTRHAPPRNRKNPKAAKGTRSDLRSGPGRANARPVRDDAVSHDNASPNANASVSARASAQGSRALSLGEGTTRKETPMSQPQRENDPATVPEGELVVRDLPKDEALALLNRIRAQVAANADAGLDELHAKRDARRKWETDRRAELKRQANELLGEESD